MAGLQQLWSRLSPSARTGVAVGGAALAAVVVIKGRGEPAAPAEPTSDSTSVDMGADGLPIGGMGAIGVDQLAAFESSIAEQLASLTDNIDTLINKPAGPSGPPKPAAQRAPKRSAILSGESADAAARRVRKTTPKTVDGKPLTGAYIVHLNAWSGNTTQRRWTGTPFLY